MKLFLNAQYAIGNEEGCFVLWDHLKRDKTCQILVHLVFPRCEVLNLCPSWGIGKEIPLSRKTYPVQHSTYYQKVAGHRQINRPSLAVILML